MSSALNPTLTEVLNIIFEMKGMCYFVSVLIAIYHHHNSSNFVAFILKSWCWLPVMSVRLDERVCLLNADDVTSARVGQLAPPSEQQGEPLP